MKRILLVEDEPDFAELTKISLEANSYGVDIAVDGAAGLKRCRTNPPDLVLLDAMLPGINGFELLRKLRRDAATRGIPVIMLTARRETKCMLHASDQGARDYLLKPCSRSDLLTAVRKHIA